MSEDRYPVIGYRKYTGCMACSDGGRHGVYPPEGPGGKPGEADERGRVRDCQRRCPVGAIRSSGDDGPPDAGCGHELRRPGIVCDGKPRVAFVCVHNSCRSQIAEALGKKLAGDVYESCSAGTELKDRINPDAVRMMKQLHGIDMEQTQRPKLLDQIPRPDVVIFMGCNVSCPNLPAQYAENWGLDDPSGRGDAAFAETIAQIEKKVLALKETLR